MKTKDYIDAAYRTAPLGYRQFSMIELECNHAQMGLTTETGEITDIIKKWLIYDKPVDRTHLVEEIGDLMWYVALLCKAMDIDLNKTMELNIKKLQARYPARFTEHHALHRDQEAEQRALED